MFRAFVQPTTPAYQPLSSHLSAETEVKFQGTMVHEAQLNRFYISPGGKTAQSGAKNRKTMWNLLWSV
jgi:voltage-dependent calcium channel L type alpha-1C